MDGRKQQFGEYLKVHRYIKFSKDLGSASPAFHLFTGSDYTAGFMRKGKIKTT